MNEFETPYPSTESRAHLPRSSGGSWSCGASGTPSADPSRSGRLGLTAPTSTSSTTARRSPTDSPLRPSAHRLRQGRHPAVPDDAGSSRRAPVRLGLPRAPGRDRGGAGAGRVRPPSHPGLRHRPVQRTLPHPSCGTRRSGSSTSAGRRAGSTSRTTTRPWTSPTWRASCGRSSSSGTRAGVRGPPGHALLLGCRDPAVQLRDPAGRRHTAAPGPRHHRGARSGA